MHIQATPLGLKTATFRLEHSLHTLHRWYARAPHGVLANAGPCRLNGLFQNGGAAEYARAQTTLQDGPNDESHVSEVWTGGRPHEFTAKHL